MLQPVKIGCVWAADKDSSADVKVLQQFTACFLETVPSEEEQTPKASKKEKKDQHSEFLPGAGVEGGQAPTYSETQISPGPRGGDFLGNGLIIYKLNKLQKPALAKHICSQQCT